MIAADIERITRAVQAVEPRARLVSLRLLRRVIRRHFELSAGARAPHDFVFELPDLLVQALVGDCGIGGGHDRVILLPLPEDVEGVTTEQLLHAYWRKLFHAAVDRAIDQRQGRFAEDRRLFHATVLHEIRVVLEDEHRLVPPDDERIQFREFAAFFLELRYFTPHMVEVYFPGFLHPDAVARFLEQRIDARSLLAATRPQGAPEPASLDRQRSSDHAIVSTSSKAAPSEREKQRASAGAKLAAKRGNDVRAAVSLLIVQKTQEAEQRLHALVLRLQRAGVFPDTESQAWFEALRPVLDHAAAQGFWDVGERLLYELQKACLDIERRTYGVDAVECIVSFGKQPIKRLLNKPRRVNVLRRLRAAAKHLARLAVASAAKDRLDRLLHHAIDAAEKRVRDENRPILQEVLDEVGIIAGNQAERISRARMIEELLDTLCVRGFLKMSDLRDALARSQVKLHDLSGPKELLLGDPLIRANRKLALRMDGIYRRGEIYMRGLQRLSSLGFGTRIGRLLVMWLILPFVASFVILSGLHEIIHVLGGLTHWLEKVLMGGGKSVADAVHSKPLLTSPFVVGLFGLFLLGLIHAPLFRREVGKWLRFSFIDVPSAVYRSPYTRRIINNVVTRFVARFVLLPLLIGSAAAILMRVFEFDWDSTLLVGGGIALLIGTLFRTPFGRGLEERFEEALARVWRIISVNFIIGLLTLILQFFRWLFEWMERGMYAVDEWLRFREGESRSTLVFKFVFGIFWFFFTYLFRFAWNLLIEPQINPIKHFPVVTVSHKLILPLSIPPGEGQPSPLAQLFMSLLGIPADPTNPVEVAKAAQTMNMVAGGIVWGIPGIFGFLVWELKENWKLYKANRSPIIEAVPVGSHGERVRGLLRPGFHSGVVPKTFAKLRKAATAGDRKKVAKHLHHLEHVAEAIEHLPERELIANLKGSSRWGGLPIHVERIVLATNRLRVFLTIHGWEGAVIISIEERGGWLIGSVEQTGWLSQLTLRQRAAFVDALTELYKLCGVHVLREQATTVLGVEPWRIDCRPEGLLILPTTEGSCVEIDYTDEPTMTPNAPIDGRAIPPLTRNDLVLSECPVEWERWVERWELDQAGKAPSVGLLHGYRVLAQ